MQLLAKFKKILYMGFRATLNFCRVLLSKNTASKTRWNVHKKILVTHDFLLSFGL